MPAGLKWTGIGLVIGSGLPILAGTLSDCLKADDVCDRERRIAYGVGGAMAGSGLVILGIAHARRSTLPDVVIGDGRAVVVQRIRF
jgi:hypothetical protein